MKSIGVLEMHVAHGCNLSCESCSHFAGNGPGGLVELAEAEAWMAPWKERLKPDFFIGKPVSARTAGSCFAGNFGSVRRSPTCDCRRRPSRPFPGNGTRTWPACPLNHHAPTRNSTASSQPTKNPSAACARRFLSISRSARRWCREASWAELIPRLSFRSCWRRADRRPALECGYLSPLSLFFLCSLHAVSAQRLGVSGSVVSHLPLTSRGTSGAPGWCVMLPKNSR